MRARLVWLVISMATVTAIGCGSTGATTRVADGSRVPDLAAEALAARRAVAIERLHAYREAGVYPTDAAGLPIGVFRDDHGVRCPMSELIFLSGRADLVDQVVRENNRLRLADVHDGPLYQWMLESGLTQEEIVAIQGAMDWRESQQFRIEGDGANLTFQVAQVRDVVRDKLVAAETMLRAGGPNSVRVAASRLSVASRVKLAAEHPAPAPAPAKRVSARP